LRGVGDLFDGYSEMARGLTRDAVDDLVDREGIARGVGCGA
jgi:hypothetical protein